MKNINTSVSISYASRQLFKLISKISRHDRIIITVKGQPKAALISTGKLESLEETIEVLSIPGALANIRKSEEQIKNGEFVCLSDLK
jgi:prevent-host-death family protein